MWCPDIEDEIQALFEQESPWDSPALYALWVVYDLRARQDAERKRAERTGSVRKKDVEHQQYLETVAALRREGLSIANIAKRVGKSAGSVHLALSRMEAGKPIPRHGRNAR